MKAIKVEGKGKEGRLVLGEATDPEPGPGEVRIRVAATAVNRADLLQRRGLYPPPPGASELLGPECAGEIDALGDGVTAFAPGDRAMALLPGGGYAERVVVHAGSVMPVPEALSLEEAAALPEVYLTAWLNLFEIGGISEGEWALVHGGGSGVGTASIQLLRRAGVHVIVTAGSDEKCARCKDLDATLALNYRSGPFSEAVLEHTGGDGVHVVLDSIGAPYLEQHLRCLRVDGRLIIIGLMGGARGEVNLGLVVAKRLSVIGSTLRARTPEVKAGIVSRFLERFGEDLVSGRVRPVVDTVLPLDRAQDAHDRVERSEHFGKVVLRVDPGP
jgi:putative PIG3 family NAD(P)H quinone oxidoreductase